MKTALITGASGAIGGATVKKFVENGYFVIGGYNRNAEKAAALKDLYKDYFFGFKADLSREEGVNSLYSFAEKNFGLYGSHRVYNFDGTRT